MTPVASVPVDITAIPVQVAPASFERVASAEPAIEAASPAWPASRVHEAPATLESIKKPAPKPAIELKLAADSSLEMIETRPREPVDATESSEPRQRRARPPRAVVADEPLQIVETRREGDSAD